MNFQTRKFRVVDAQFLASEHEFKALSKYALSEVAFVGRSNVGKSSLLNAICERRVLARVSKTPGRTQALNYFSVRLRDMRESGDGADGEDRGDEIKANFVDLPGFGYAAVGAKTRKLWANLLTDYITKRSELRQVILLLDARRELEREELWFFSQQLSAQLILVLTKVDKLSKVELQSKLSKLKAQLGDLVPEIIPTAADAAQKQGIERLCNAIGQGLESRQQYRTNLNFPL